MTSTIKQQFTTVFPWFQAMKVQDSAAIKEMVAETTCPSAFADDFKLKTCGNGWF
jgi:hypothetical protein